MIFFDNIDFLIGGTRGVGVQTQLAYGVWELFICLLAVTWCWRTAVILSPEKKKALGETSNLKASGSVAPSARGELSEGTSDRHVYGPKTKESARVSERPEKDSMSRPQTSCRPSAP